MTAKSCMILMGLKLTTFNLHLNTLACAAHVASITYFSFTHMILTGLKPTTFNLHPNALASAACAPSITYFSFRLLYDIYEGMQLQVHASAMIIRHLICLRVMTANHQS